MAEAMDMELTHKELELIRESLRYTVQVFQNYDGYPSYEFKQQRIAEAEAVAAKVSALLREARHRDRGGNIA